MICSELSASLGEDMGGSAPTESRILVVEQPGPWGRDAVSDSALAPIAADLAEHAAAAGARIQLVRRQTRRYAVERPRAWLATVGGALERLEIEHPRDLLDMALDPGAGVADPEPLFLVCTHSTRDPCCARHGLPLHRALTAAGARTWHASHLGGHRFAATMAVLPLGAWLGRVPAQAAGEVAADLRAGRLPLPYLRGLAGRPAAVQAAELAVRQALALPAVSDLSVHGHDADGRVRLLTRDGREVVTQARWEPTGAVRALSCGPGAKTEDPGHWVVTGPTLDT